MMYFITFHDLGFLLRAKTMVLEIWPRRPFWGCLLQKCPQVILIQFSYIQEKDSISTSLTSEAEVEAVEAVLSKRLDFKAYAQISSSEVLLNLMTSNLPKFWTECTQDSHWFFWQFFHAQITEIYSIHPKNVPPRNDEKKVLYYCT